MDQSPKGQCLSKLFFHRHLSFHHTTSDGFQYLAWAFFGSSRRHCVVCVSCPVGLPLIRRLLQVRNSASVKIMVISLRPQVDSESVCNIFALRWRPIFFSLFPSSTDETSSFDMLSYDFRCTNQIRILVGRSTTSGPDKLDGISMEPAKVFESKDYDSSS